MFLSAGVTEIASMNQKGAIPLVDDNHVSTKQVSAAPYKREGPGKYLQISNYILLTHVLK